MKGVNEDDLFAGVEDLGISEDSLFTGLDINDTITPVEPDASDVVLQQFEKDQRIDLAALADKQEKDRQRALIEESNPGLTKLYPRVTEAKIDEIVGNNPGFMQKSGAIMNDALSIPGRLLAAAEDFEGDTWTERINNYWKSVGKTEGSGFVSSMMRHPVTAAAIGLAPFLSASSPFMAAGAEGAGTALVSQMDRLAKGEDVSPEEVLADISLSFAMPGFSKVFKKYSPKTKEMILTASEKINNPALEAITSELSGISGEALQMARTKKGSSTLIKMSNKADEIGTKFLDMLDNPDNFYKYEEQIKTALNDMPDISIKNVKQSLKNSINDMGNLPHEKAAKSKLEAYLSGINEDFKPKKIGTEYVTEPIPLKERGLGGSKKIVKKDVFYRNNLISANRFRDLRKRLDYVTSFDKEGSELFNDALKKARTTAMFDLIEAGKGTPYEKTMQNYSNFIQTRDNLFRKLGKRSETRQDRVQSFMDNMFGRNKGNQQRIMKDIDSMFGSNFLEKVKLASLGKEITSKHGKIPLFASQTTGRSIKGDMTAMGMVGTGLGTSAMTGNLWPAVAGGVAGLGTLALSSPKLAPKMLNLSEDAMAGLARMPGLGNDIMNNPILQRTVPGLGRIPLKDAVGDQ